MKKFLLIMRKNILFASLLIATNFFCLAEIVPFEKKGKWGLIDQGTGKTIVKNKYLALEPMENAPNMYKVCGEVKDENYYINDRKYKLWGVIDQTGKIIIPIKASYIIDAPNILFAGYESKNKLSTAELERMGAIYSNAYAEGDKEEIELEGYTLDGRRVSSGRRIREGNWIHTNNKAIPILNVKTKKGFSISSDYSLTGFDNNEIYFAKQDPNNEERIEILTIDENGNRKSSFGRIVEGQFIPESSKGKIMFGGIEVDKVEKLPDYYRFFMAEKDGKWGILETENDYDYYDGPGKATIVVPFKLAGPIIDKRGMEYFVVKTDHSKILYDKEGEVILEIKDGFFTDVNDDRVFVSEKGDYENAVYSRKNNRWIIKPSIYKELEHFSNGNYAGRLAGETTYKFLNSEGKVLTVINNVESFQEEKSLQGDAYYIKVRSTKNKIGILNPKTGQLVIPCIYETGWIPWGGGSGSNRRICLSQESSKGTTLTVFTVSGRKIASKFFPYGVYEGTVKAWANQYLY